MASEHMEDLAGQMFDLLAAQSNPIQRDDIMSILSIRSVSEFHEIKGVLQDLLGGTDTINVVADSTSDPGGWYYSLDGDPNSPTATKYVIYKLRVTFTRQRRAWDVVASIHRGADGRTLAGRVLAMTQRSIERSMEDTIAAISELGGVPPSMP